MLSSLYLPKSQFNVLDIGSYNVNGELRSALHASDLITAHDNVVYVGLDIEAGPNVDVVVSLKDKAYPFPEGHFDAVTSTSAFEHDPRFWMTYLKMLTVLKPGGLLYVSVPHTQSEHRFPVDCWRFYGDAGEALASWGRENDFQVDLVFNSTILQFGDEAISNGRDNVMAFYKRHERDTDGSVALVIDHFSRFLTMYEQTRNANIFAQAAWSRQMIFEGNDIHCAPGSVTALNGSAYEINTACYLTLVV